MLPLIFVLFCGTALAQTRPAPAVEIGGANLPAQRIGANDLIALSVYDATEFTRTIRVSAEGDIRLPMLKQKIRAQGRLPGELESAIADALSAEELIVDPAVTVTIVEYHSRPISVAGAVKNPVTFQAVDTVTLLDAITRAGGLSPEAGLEILVSRVGPGRSDGPVPVERIPVKGLIDAADPELNIKLEGGEEIRVPEVGKIFVVGNVKKPGAYSLQDTGETTVLEMLALAEGLAPYAARQAYIFRRAAGSGSKQEITIELKRILERKAPDVALEALAAQPDDARRRVGGLEQRGRGEIHALVGGLG